MVATAGSVIEEMDEMRWRAVVGRRRDVRESFVFGVRSTGVYCRPGCPARTPRRENVLFFESTDVAQAAGYRACLRCLPDATSDDAEVSQAIVEVCRLLEDPDGPRDIATLAGMVGWSPRHLTRAFKAAMGVTIGAYARAQQAERARRALRAGALVSDAVYEAGYGSARAFYEHGASRLGARPAAYRNGSPGTVVRYVSGGSALGRIVVASTDAGVCAVRIGDDERELVGGLRREFAAATLEEDVEGLAPVLAVAVALAAGRAVPTTDLPFDLRGTAFQVAVWEALRTIERGERRTYGEIARQIGRPDGQRAVANACASNPAALLVPCHRVVRGDGQTGGYRWGAERKAKLLAAEGGAT